jgi:hypothetical protein
MFIAVNFTKQVDLNVMLYICIWEVLGLILGHDISDPNILPSPSMQMLG